MKVTGSDPAGYDLGDVSQYFGDWDSHIQIVYSISCYVKAFTESKVRNVLDLGNIEYNYKTGSFSVRLVSAPYLMKHTFIITSPMIVVTIIRHHKISTIKYV